MENNLPAALLPNLPASTPGASLPWDAGGGGVLPFYSLSQMLDLSGTEYVNVADAASLTSAGAFSFCGWFNHDAASTAACLAGKYDYNAQCEWMAQVGDGADATLLVIDVAATLSTGFGGYFKTASGSWFVGVPNWFLVAFDPSGSQEISTPPNATDKLRIEINGVPQQLAKTGAGALPAAVVDGTAPFRIGGVSVDAGATITRKFDGKVSDCKWFNGTALTHAQGLEHMQRKRVPGVLPTSWWKFNGDATDSAGVNHGTVT